MRLSRHVERSVSDTMGTRWQGFCLAYVFYAQIMSTCPVQRREDRLPNSNIASQTIGQIAPWDINLHGACRAAQITMKLRFVNHAGMVSRMLETPIRAHRLLYRRNISDYTSITSSLALEYPLGGLIVYNCQSTVRDGEN